MVDTIGGLCADSVYFIPIRSRITGLNTLKGKKFGACGL
jgi:hypothetical protein